ncbi:MAG: nuclear transport factor 2 family protein [Candidatus Dormibacteraceae bacterium]
MSGEDSERLAERVVAALNTHDRSQVERLTTADVQLRLPPGMVFYGQSGVRQFFTELEERLPELTVVARRIYSGDHFAIVEWESVGQSRSRAQVETMGVFVMQLVDGLIERIQLYLDTAQWARLTEELRRT